MKKLKIRAFPKKFTIFLSSRGWWLPISLGLVPALLIFYSAYTFYLSPTAVNLSESAQKVQKLEAEVKRGQAVENSQSAFKQEFIKIVNLFNESQKLLPKETEISDILAQLQLLADQNNVRVILLSASKSGVKSPNAVKLYERDLPVIIRGEYPNVLKFWNELARLSRITVVRSLEVKNSEKTSVRTFVEASFSLLVFHAPPPAEIPQIPFELNQ